MWPLRASQTMGLLGLILGGFVSKVKLIAPGTFQKRKQYVKVSVEENGEGGLNPWG